MARIDLAEWALYLARMGWPVFPLHPHSKTPTGHRAADCPRTGRCTAGHRTPEQRATTDPALIREAWAHRGWNIGLACGPARLLVVDLDVAKTPDAADGATVLAALAEARGVSIPATYTVDTPSGGQHRYFQLPAGVRLRNTSGHLGPGIDTRAAGGYVVAPGSILPNGGYELADDTDPADLPAWLLQALCQHPARSRTPATPEPVRTRGYGPAALAGECDHVRTAPRGQHNATLSRAAYRLGQLVGAGLLDHHTARAALLEAAQPLIGGDCDCTAGEIERVTDAGLDAGAQQPRTVSPAMAQEVAA